MTISVKDILELRKASITKFYTPKEGQYVDLRTIRKYCEENKVPIEEVIHKVFDKNLR